jgi:hypothetical protein
MRSIGLTMPQSDCSRNWWKSDVASPTWVSLRHEIRKNPEIRMRHLLRAAATGENKKTSRYQWFGETVVLRFFARKRAIWKT